MPKLFVKSGDQQDQVFHLNGDRISIGRGVDNPVRLLDQEVSRHHATLISEYPGYRLEDQSSVNGVLVNGEPTACHTLSFGDEIKIGSTRLIYLPEDETWEPSGEAELPTSVSFLPDEKPSDFEMEISLPSDPMKALESHAKPEALERLMILYRISHELAGFLDPKSLMQKILERVIETLQADRGFYVVVDPQTGEPEVKSMRMRYARAGNQTVTISRTIIDHVMQTEKAVLTNNVKEDERFKSAQSIVNLDIHSTMSVPIKGKDGIIGILQVDTQSKSIGFTREDLELMTAISNQVGIAIENATLINDLKTANDELQRQQQQLIEAEKLSALGKLAGGVAHEINNPMTSILGYTQLTADALKKASDAKTLKQCAENLEIVQGEAHRCSAIAQTLLQFGRKGRAIKDLTKINDVIERSLAVARFHLNHKIELKTSLAEDLLDIVADGQQLQQVFLNLIINARDAMENGGTLSITSDQKKEDEIRIQVSDTGCGIPAEKLKEIFKPLYTSKEEGKGTGLGLSVSQDIIVSHQGTIDVSSTPGEGTTFMVTLPTPDLSDLPLKSDESKSDL